MSEGRLKSSRCAIVFLANVFLMFFSSSIMADDESPKGVFFNTNIKLYNAPPAPLLSNEDLVIRANQLRNTSADISVAGDDYQWLSSQLVPGFIDGQKAVRRLLERRIKEYIYATESSQWLKEKLLPEQNGNSFIKDVNYDVKLRSDEVVFGLIYEF